MTFRISQLKFCLADHHRSILSPLSLDYCSCFNNLTCRVLGLSYRLKSEPSSPLQDDHSWHLISALHKQGWTALMTHAYGWAFTDNQQGKYKKYNSAGWRLSKPSHTIYYTLQVYCLYIKHTHLAVCHARMIYGGVKQHACRRLVCVFMSCLSVCCRSRVCGWLRW